MSDTKHVVVTREGLQRMKEELEYKETTEKMMSPSSSRLRFPTAT